MDRVSNRSLAQKASDVRQLIRHVFQRNFPIRFPLIVVFSTLMLNAATASELKSGDFSFELPGNWRIVSVREGSARAERNQSKQSRICQLSVFQSKSADESVRQYAELVEYLGNLDPGSNEIVKASDIKDFQSSRAPFKYVVYSY